VDRVGVSCIKMVTTPGPVITNSNEFIRLPLTIMLQRFCFACKNFGSYTISSAVVAA